MSAQMLYPAKGFREAGVIKLYGNFTTSTGGTIASSGAKGFTIAKTGSETGRYTLTLNQAYVSFLGASVAIEGAADAAYTSAKGLTWVLRGVDVSSTKVIYLQFNDPDGSPADAELEDGAKVYIELTLKDTSAY